MLTMQMFSQDNFEPVIITDSHGENPTIYFVLAGICALAFIASFMFFLVSKPSSDSYSLSLKLFITGTIMAALGFIPLGIGANIHKANNQPNKTQNNVEETQKWAEETYLVSFNDKEVNRLINGRSDFTNTGKPLITKYAIGDFYGENIMITLVKVNDEWLLYSNGKELPKTTK